MKNKNLVPAFVPPPGEVIDMELEARGWTVEQLAKMIGYPSQLIDEIIEGQKPITSLIAHQLANVFGTSSELWNNLEANYQRYLAPKGSQSDSSLFTIPTPQWTKALPVGAD